jgi:hypothetical protein
VVSAGHVTGLDIPQTPAALHVSPNVHAAPSSQLAPVRTVWVQVAVPLHARSMHAEPTQLTVVPAAHTPADEHASP